jgi:hypothetical protein
MNMFIKEIAKDNHCYDPIRYLSSSYFSSTWNFFLDFQPQNHKFKRIQDAARSCIDLMMNGESVYWNIDFSEEHATKVWRLFFDGLKSCTSTELLSIQKMSKTLAVNKNWIDSIEFFINLASRVRRDAKFRSSINISISDYEILEIAYESIEISIIDRFKIRDNWLLSTDDWDMKLKQQTPDLPESVYLIFIAAYESNQQFPSLIKNIDILIPDDLARRDFFRRLKISFDLAKPNGSNILFPINS